MAKLQMGLLALVVAFILSASMVVGKYDTKFLYGLQILAHDNVTLSADGFLPKPKSPGERFPAVIFPNSWGVPQIEYILKVLKLAEEGYVGIEYETRGWYSSGGEIDTAGPLDREDTKTVFDFVVAHADEWNVNTSRIAFVGISYGAGLSLMAAGYNDKIRTAVAMSGWDRFDDGFYYNRSPAKKELGGLLHDAEKNGRIPSELTSFYQYITNHQNMSTVHDFANSRSPETLYLDTYNTRKTPIFLSNNLMDRFFFPQTKIHFYSRLQGPKFQLLNHGSHAEPEAVGLADIPHNYIWGKVFKWLEYWLKDIDNGIMDEPPIQVQCGTSMFAENYTAFSQWPDPVKAKPMTLYLTPRGSSTYGGLSASPAAAGAAPDRINFKANPSLDEGEDTDSSLGFPSVFTFSAAAPKDSSLVYLTEAFSANTELCGTVMANFSLTVPSDGKWQIYGYMYDVVDGKGSIMGDMLYTHWAHSSQQQHHSNLKVATSNVAGSSTTTVQISNVEFRTICQVIEAGHQFGIAFVLDNTWYSTSSTTASVAFNYDASTTVVLPRVQH